MVDYEKRIARRRCVNAIVILLVVVVIIGVIFLAFCLASQYKKPRFSIVGAAVHELNVTRPGLISATMQFTILTRNPNRRVSIYYDSLSAFVSYRGQMITQPVSLPRLFLYKKSTVALSPVLGGPNMAVPVLKEVADGLEADEADGVVGMSVRLKGRLRYKGGIVRTGCHWVNVRCDVLVGLTKGFAGEVPLLASACKI